MSSSDTFGAAAGDTPRPLRKDAARNRQSLIDAARVVFAERGLEASLDDVAHEAGLGVGTAYRHFANKFELARAVFQAAVDKIVALAESATNGADPWAGIVSFLEGAAEAQTADRGLREVLMGVHDEDEMEQISLRLTPLLTELVARAKADGSVRADAEVSDIGVVVTMLCSVADLGGELAPELWRRYLPWLLDGLRAGDVLPVAPMPEDQLRKALAAQKLRVIRGGQPPR